MAPSDAAAEAEYARFALGVVEAAVLRGAAESHEALLDVAVARASWRFPEATRRRFLALSSGLDLPETARCLRAAASGAPLEWAFRRTGATETRDPDTE